jgi:hypothetical protein
MSRTRPTEEGEEAADARVAHVPEGKGLHFDCDRYPAMSEYVG